MNYIPVRIFLKSADLFSWQ